ncbi:MAG: DMT family transporter [Methylobacteriaceae bacterium]|nr:DMT family transporter [Methylobacteriaceae bacterium]
MAAIAGSEHRRGVALVAAGAVMWSTAGVFMRMLGLDVWTILAWRAFFGALFLFAWLVIEHRRNTWRVIRSLSLAGVLAIPAATAIMISYVTALKLTTVADVLIVNAVLPFVAAGIAWVWIGERAERRTLVAAGVALAGVVIIVGDSALSGRLLGDLLAFVTTLIFAAVMVLVRRQPQLSVATINGFGALLCAAICFQFAPGETVGIRDMAVIAAFGFTSLAFALLLFLAGARLIPSGEAGLISLLETVLGPLWVWIAFAETPTPAVIVGGIVVLAAVAWHLIGDWWRESKITDPSALRG